MGSTNLQMRPTADFSFIRSGCLLIMLVCNLCLVYFFLVAIVVPVYLLLL